MMPTYGQLHGTYVTVNVSEAIFEAIEPGVRHVMKIAIRNVSMRGQRIRLVPPRPKGFTLTSPMVAGSGQTSPPLPVAVQNDVDLAPGLQMEVELAYLSDAPEDVEAQLVVQVGRADVGEGEQLVIPVRATLPGAKLVFDLPVDFGVVVPGQKTSRELVVRNDGSRDGRFGLTPAPAGSKFSVMPLEAHIAPGASARFSCELKADAELGPLSVKLPLSLNGLQGFHPKPAEIELRAQVADPTVLLLDAEGKALSKSEFGRVYCGLTSSVGATLVNNGPGPINFNVAKAASEEGGMAPPDEGEEAEEVLTASPSMGRIPAGGSLPITFHFTPPKRPQSAKGFVSGGDVDEGYEERSANLHVEV